MNVYIYKDWSWEPWSNTIAYYPLNSTNTVNDMSGNNKNMTNNWVSFGTYNGVSCASFSSSYLDLDSSLFTWNQIFTVSTRFYWDWTIISGKWKCIFTVGSPSWTSVFCMWTSPGGVLKVWWWSNDRDTGIQLTANKWYQCIMTHSWWTINVYLDWTLIYTWTVSYNIASYKTRIGCQLNTTDYFFWNISEVIVESTQWTAQEVLDYYNGTKSLYWIS